MEDRLEPRREDIMELGKENWMVPSRKIWLETQMEV